MKIRNDFVTNSSSSSFVIAYKKWPKIDDETIKKYPFLSNFDAIMECILQSGGYSNCSDETTSAETIRSVDDLNSWFIDAHIWGLPSGTSSKVTRNNLENYLCHFQPEHVEMYNKAKEYLKKGYTIASKKVSYDDEALLSMLYATVDGENIVLL